MYDGVWTDIDALMLSAHFSKVGGLSTAGKVVNPTTLIHEVGHVRIRSDLDVTLWLIYSPP
jgi:hypothetical protein